MSDTLHYVIQSLLSTKGHWPAIEQASGVSRRTFEKIVHGQTLNPRMQTVEKLASYFREREAA